MGVAGKTASSSDSGKQGWGGGTEIVSEDVPIPNQHAGVIIRFHPILIRFNPILIRFNPI